MKRKICVAVLLCCAVVSIVLMAVFIPHFQRETNYSGGVLEVIFEDGSIQYVASGGTIKVESGSKVKVKVITSTDSKNHILCKGKDVVEESQELVFDETKVYVFDLYAKASNDVGKNYIASYFVEVAQ